MSSPIRTENLVKKFRKVEALHGVNLEVPPGAIYPWLAPMAPVKRQPSRY
jgi:ABC-type multidrug transport system ATPase subunit